MSILIKYHFKILWLLIILYVLIFGSVCFWKYQNFGYNSLDLAIFNQVFFNNAHGQPFASSIHFPSYLGDHFTPILFLLLPFYFIYQSPLTLLLLQTLFLALAAWPLYLIGKKVFKEPKFYLFLPFIYLLNPFIHNINVFEFHELALAPFIFFFAFYFYQKEKFWPWLGFIILGLTLREDASFLIFFFGLFILADKLIKKEKIKLSWIITPLLLSLAYFFLSLKITTLFAPGGQYKFLLYYSWLGNSLPEIIKNFLLHPHLVLLQILRLKNWEMVLALLLPFLGLPLLKPQYLILALGTFLQLTVSDVGSSVLIIQLHYVALLAIPLFIATAYSLQTLLDKPKLKNYQDLTILLLLITTIYCTITLGFGYPRVRQPESISLKRQMMNEVPKNSTLITTYEFLPYFSNNNHLYSLNYSFLGKKQLSTADYQLPENINYLLADLAETVTYQMQYEDLKFYRENYYQGANRLRKLIAGQNLGLINLQDTLAIFKRDEPSKFSLYEIKKSPPQDLFNCQRIANSEQPSRIATQNVAGGRTAIYFSCQVQFINPPTENYQLELEQKKDGQTVYSRLLPLAYGFYTTSELKPDELLITKYNLILSPQITDEICLNLIKLKGSLGLNKMGSLYNFIKTKKTLQTSCFNYSSSSL